MRNNISYGIGTLLGATIAVLVFVFFYLPQHPVSVVYDLKPPLGAQIAMCQNDIVHCDKRGLGDRHCWCLMREPKEPSSAAPFCDEHTAPGETCRVPDPMPSATFVVTDKNHGYYIDLNDLDRQGKIGRQIGKGDDKTGPACCFPGETCPGLSTCPPVIP